MKSQGASPCAAGTKPVTRQNVCKWDMCASGTFDIIEVIVSYTQGHCEPNTRSLSATHTVIVSPTRGHCQLLTRSLWAPHTGIVHCYCSSSRAGHFRRSCGPGPPTRPRWARCGRTWPEPNLFVYVKKILVFALTVNHLCFEQNVSLR